MGIGIPRHASGSVRDATFGNQSPKCSALHVQTYLLGLRPHLNMLMTSEQEEYIKEEQRSLKRELLRAQEEVKRIQSVPLVIGQFLEMVDGNSGIVGSTTGVPTSSALRHQTLPFLHMHKTSAGDLPALQSESTGCVSHKCSVSQDAFTKSILHSIPRIHIVAIRRCYVVLQGPTTMCASCPP